MSDEQGLYVVTVNGQPHTGAYLTKAEAERQVATVRGHYPDKRDVIEVAPHLGGAGKFATTDAPGTLGVKPAVSAQEPGSAQIPSEGMLPGPGGAVQTEMTGAVPEGKAGTNADLPGATKSVAPKK